MPRSSPDPFDEATPIRRPGWLVGVAYAPPSVRVRRTLNELRSGRRSEVVLPASGGDIVWMILILEEERVGYRIDAMPGRNYVLTLNQGE